MATRYRHYPQGGHFGDSSYTISQKHAKITERTASLGKRITVYVLSCPDYVQHHVNETQVEQQNSGIPLKTQQRIEMALKLFPDADIKVLFADSEVLHEGKHQDEKLFLGAVRGSMERVGVKYPTVLASTFFEEAGSRGIFEDKREHFYKVLEAKIVKSTDSKQEREQKDRRLSQSLEYEVSNARKRLSSRRTKVPEKYILAERVLRNSFAEILTIGDILRSGSTPSGLCPSVVVFDQSVATGLFNDGDKHGSTLPRGLAPVPLILANSASTV